jgi:hypothetical protein
MPPAFAISALCRESAEFGQLPGVESGQQRHRSRPAGRNGWHFTVGAPRGWRASTWNSPASTSRADLHEKSWLRPAASHHELHGRIHVYWHDCRSWVRGRPHTQQLIDKSLTHICDSGKVDFNDLEVSFQAI